MRIKCQTRFCLKYLLVDFTLDNKEFLLRLLKEKTYTRSHLSLDSEHFVPVSLFVLVLL